MVLYVLSGKLTVETGYSMCKYCEQFNYEAYDVVDGTTHRHAVCLAGMTYDTNCFAAITNKKQLLIAGEDVEQMCYYYETKKINYCPMCGRKLS